MYTDYLGRSGIDTTYVRTATEKRNTRSYKNKNELR